MKIDELMIGDWLLYKSDSLDNAFPIQVTREMFNKELVVWKDRFEPITLTPEILEKNGFERDKNISLYNAYTGINSRVTLHDDFMLMNSRNMWDVHIDSEDYCTIANCELTYVHELQNILRLCKIDKEIVV
jgi:hypothetical protein